MRRFLPTAVALTAAAALAPSTAHAAAPAAQVDSLRSGVAILQAKTGQVRSLRARLDALGARGFTLPRLGMVVVRGDAAALRRFARQRQVRYAHRDQRVKLLLHNSTPIVYDGRQESLWQGGFDGRGVGVAIVDSGVDATHPDLGARVTRNVKVLSDVDGLFGEGVTGLPPILAACPTTCTTDTTSGHGTHVAGIAAGNGTASDGFHTGVAPGANLIGYGVGEALSIFWYLAAFEDILANREEHNIRVVNNSWGPLNQGDLRADLTGPVPQATKRLHDAGITVVFAAGNDGPAANEDRPPGASECSTVEGEDGREASDGVCKMNIHSVSPWTLSAASSVAKMEGGPSRQGLSLFSSRGDTQPQTTLDGTPNVLYQPTITAPGSEIRSARALTGAVAHASCGTSVLDPSACVTDRPQDEPRYAVASGTSMASPHVAGAVAVVQQAAQVKLGRALTPAEVRTVLTTSATPMTNKDGFWEFPCGQVFYPVACGEPLSESEYTGQTYERWHVGAGMLNVAAAVDAVGRLKKKPKR
jgi:serine protease AprX